MHFDLTTCLQPRGVNFAYGRGQADPEFVRRYYRDPARRAVAKVRQVRAIYGPDSPNARFADAMPLDGVMVRHAIDDALNGRRVHSDAVLLDLLARGAGEDSPEYQLAQTYVQIKPLTASLIAGLVQDLLLTAAELARVQQVLQRKVRANRVRKAVQAASMPGVIIARKDMQVTQLIDERRRAYTQRDAAVTRADQMQSLVDDLQVMLRDAGHIGHVRTQVATLIAKANKADEWKRRYEDLRDRQATDALDHETAGDGVPNVTPSRDSS